MQPIRVHARATIGGVHLQHGLVGDHVLRDQPFRARRTRSPCFACLWILHIQRNQPDWIIEAHRSIRSGTLCRAFSIGGFTHRQHQRARSRINAEPFPAWLRPDPRPVGARNSYTEHVAGRETVAHARDRDLNINPLTNRHRYGLIAAFAGAEVQVAAGHQGRRAVLSDIVDAHIHLATFGRR